MAATKKKVLIDENDVYKIFRRYSPKIILSLLQEVHQYSGKKVDWNALVQKSTTGISNAREYQMLWRHLAYRGPLLEKLELGAGTQPLDDDSDLECQLEVVPSVSTEASREAAAYVKKLKLPTDGLVESPFVASVRPPKKRRKVWTKQEDDELISAVQRYGEGNWANILKGEFKHDRTASQLYKRWLTIRKQIGISDVGGGNTASSCQSEDVLVATKKAVSMALNTPSLGSSATKKSGIRQPSPLSAPASTSPAVPVNISTFPTVPASVLSTVSPSVSAPASQKVSNRATNRKEVLVSSSNRSIITVKKFPSSVEPSVSPIQAAAFAAGGRIATPHTAVPPFKSARSGAAFHIRPCSSTLPKPTARPTKLLPPTSTASIQVQSRQTRPGGLPPPYAGAKLGSRYVKESSGRYTSYIPTISCAPTSFLYYNSKHDTSNTKVDDLLEFDEMVARERLSSKHRG